MILEKDDLLLAIKNDDRTPDHILVWYFDTPEGYVCEYSMDDIDSIDWDKEINRMSLRFKESDWVEENGKMVNYCGVRVFPKNF